MGNVVGKLCGEGGTDPANGKGPSEVKSNGKGCVFDRYFMTSTAKCRLKRSNIGTLPYPSSSSLSLHSFPFPESLSRSCTTLQTRWARGLVPRLMRVLFVASQSSKFECAWTGDFVKPCSKISRIFHYLQHRHVRWKERTGLQESRYGWRGIGGAR